MCNRVTAAQEIECSHYSCGLKLSEGKPSYKPLLSRLWAPWWAVPGSTTLLFWQSHTDDDRTSSFLPPLPTGPQAGEQALLLFLVILLSGSWSYCCLVAVSVLFFVPLRVTLRGLLLRPAGKGCTRTYPPECTFVRGGSQG